MFIAIITRGLDVKRPIERRAITAETKDAVIAEAIRVRTRIGDHYKIYVGELTSEIVIPIKYKEVNI